MVRNLFCAFVSFLIITGSLIASNPDATNEMSIQGFYFGKNIYIINPMKGNEYAVKSVFINEIPAQDELNSSAFEIDFSRYQLKEGDAVSIRIVYAGSMGTPYIFNPEVLAPQNTFRFVSAECDKKLLQILWTVDGKDLTESFEVEHYRWDKWMTISLINPEETKTFPSYTVPFVPHSGRNLFRVKYVDNEGNVYYSTEIKYSAKVKEVLLVSDKVKESIDFSEETRYQLYSENGALLLDGWGKTIDILAIEKGKYFLNYDNKTAIITKR